MAWCVIKFKHRKGQKAKYEPENKKLEIWLTSLTAVGVVAMLAPGLVVWGDFVSPPEDSMVVEAVGQQWNWSFRYPGDDGELGDVDPALITPENPFGMSPDDPNGQDDILVFNQEMHLPLGEPVKLLLRSKDVLHNFAVPQFRVKMDIVPGMTSFQWFQTTRTGSFEIMCEELCGIGHHVMRGVVIVDTPEEYAAWRGDQTTYAQYAASRAADLDAGRTLYAACAACHGANGEGNQMLNAPKLAGLERAYMQRQLEHYQSGIRGGDPSDTLGAQMRGMAATLPDAAAINNVTAYIASFEHTPSKPTITGNVERGKEIYETCRRCHGGAGEGIWAMQAPRQAGMDDWYILAQLQNFKSGLRGSHESDWFGGQMVQMAQMLSDDEEMYDLIAYINSL
jgi:cytochrome c oxidase subunit 2